MTGILGACATSGPPTPPLQPRDGHFLAGFIDAEGCFQITANNGGTSWRCGFTLALRDDDAELLVDLQRLTGLGHLTRAPARGTSMPQALWSIDSRREALQLAELLEQFPLRGRKRREADVWSEAARDLERNPRAERLSRLAADIRSLKRYVNLEPTPRSTPRLDDDLVAYIGGFFTGEGHLSISGARCRLIVRLRDDDRPLLEDLASATGLGRLYASPRCGNTAPAVAWLVYRHDQLGHAARLLERAGLRGRKAREFAVWRNAAIEFASARAQGRVRDLPLVEAAHAALQDERNYRAGASFETPSPRERRVERCLDALQHFARATHGPLTVTTYSTYRQHNPHLPDRNTIVRVFGSWSQALNAAGLGDRCARHPAARPEPEEFTWRELTHRRVERGRVVGRVSRLRGTVGRVPTVHEYLAWRAGHDRRCRVCRRSTTSSRAGGRSVTTVARNQASAQGASRA
jgi:hypothetical protein